MIFPGIPAHKVSWELHYGPVPEGMLVLHNCPGGDNPSCVNPAHLWLGTYSDNMHDMYVKRRRPKGQKITAAIALEIRKRRRNGELSKPLAAEYGVSESLVCQIGRGEAWAYY